MFTMCVKNVHSYDLQFHVTYKYVEINWLSLHNIFHRLPNFY